jgi:tRNA-dihydrouridine synthase
MSEGVANWDEIARAVVLKNQMRPEVKIIGNGDVISLDMANQQVRQFDVDGVMVGRGIFKNPWLFNQDPVDPRPDQRINTLLRHARLYQQMWGTSRNFAILKRFFKIYLTGFEGASDLRHQLMQTNSITEVEAILEPVMITYWRG